MPALCRCPSNPFEFWKDLNSAKRLRQESWVRLKLRRKYCHFQYKPHRNLKVAREEFHGAGIAWSRRCFACREKGHHRHHIIQLQHGGPNVPSNIVTLCRECHADVHSKKKLQPAGVLQWKKDLTPRLVRSSASQQSQACEVA